MGSPVKEGAKERLLQYMLMVRDRMRLSQWDLAISDDRAEDHNGESTSLDIQPNIRLFFATVRIGSFFDNGDHLINNKDERRRAVVHELVHLHQAELMYWLEHGDWKLPLSPDHARTIEEKVLHELEIQAELAARLIAPQMPYGPEEWDEPSGQ